ncbi:MAG: hypothetical protein H5T83_13320 [Actinotalea sp.]|nr:hypothetical protein [Actinotalea sp.]
MTDTLGEIADALYALRLEEFVAARDARAKELRAAGDRDLAGEVAGLRRPTTAAWAVNQLVRARREEVEQLLELGAALREAQETFAGPELRQLDRQQRQVVAAIRRQAHAVAAERGQRLSETVGRQVEATLKAGMADPAAARAVRSGRLVTDLESTGFGPVPLQDAVAVAPASDGGGTARRRVGGHRRQTGRPQVEAERREQESRAEEQRQEAARRAREGAQAALEVAEQEQREAEGRLAEMTDALAAVEADRVDAASRLAELRRRLAEAEDDDARLAGELETARRARGETERAAAAARDAVGRARERLDAAT